MKRLSVLFSLVLLFVSANAFAASPYVSVGGAFLRSNTTTLRDRDCSSAQPPALFGCGNGNDRLPLAARGDFGDTPLFRVAAGLESSGARIELELATRPSLDFDANGNFTGVASPQPVRAGGSSRSALAIVAREFGSARVQPFIAAGAGVARNETSSVRLTFPSIASDATTTIRGGAQNRFAWTASAGASLALTSSLNLDLTFRYDDLGTMQTDAGSATIVRPTRTLTLDVAGTRARLRAGGLAMSVRWRI
jgi:opacity protein-like surface antigen